jgi:hypothetical protein
MMPIVRMRLEKNVEYHEAVVESQKKMIEAKQQQQHEPQEDEGRRSRRGEQPQQQEDPSVKQSQAIIEMHAEAAKQLRDILRSEPLQPAIHEVLSERTVMRDRGPVARTQMN